MLDILLAAKNANDASQLRFSFNGETSGPTYLAVRNAAGFTTGATRSDNTWLGFTEKANGDVWIIPKFCIAYNVTMAAMSALNVFNGKTIQVSGRNYYCKSISMTKNNSFTASDVANGGVAVANNGTVFADSDFNHLFYPIIAGDGSSPEGIKYGTAASYTGTQLGFASGTPNATIGREENESGYHILVNSNYPMTNRYSRTGSSTSWGWRPMLRDDGAV